MFEGFEILEQAALEMIGEPDEAACLEKYRALLLQCLLGRGVEPNDAPKLADHFVEIIALRRREIALASGNITESLQ
jgi:hypothetical protein